MRVTDLVRQQVADRWSQTHAPAVVAALEARAFSPYVEEERVCLAILKLLLEGHDPSIVSAMDDWREVLARRGMRSPP